MPFGFLSDLFTSEQEQQSTSTRTPWGAAIPGLKTVADIVEGGLGRPLEFFPGQTYAPQTEAERQQIAALMGAADQWGGTVMPAFESALNAPNVAENPYVQGMAEAIQSRVNRNLEENILPAIRMGEVGTGAYGTGGDVARGIASRGTSDVLAENLADLYGQAWRTGLGAQSQALGMAPGMMGAPAGFYGQAGALERAEAQRPITEEMQRFQFGQMEPWQRAQLGYGVLGPMGGLGGTAETTGTVTSTPSPFQQLSSVAGLALGGLGGLGAMGIGPAAGMGMGGMGMYPGGFGGAMVPIQYSQAFNTMPPWGYG